MQLLFYWCVYTSVFLELSCPLILVFLFEIGDNRTARFHSLMFVQIKSSVSIALKSIKVLYRAKQTVHLNIEISSYHNLATGYIFANICQYRTNIIIKHVAGPALISSSVADVILWIQLIQTISIQ